MANENNSGRTADLNSIEIHNFSKGWSVDLDNHAEKPESYSDAWNGRLFSQNGTLAFTSINGDKFVYENANVLKFNGHFAFQDELIVWAKGDFPIFEQETEIVSVDEILVSNFSVSSATNEILDVDFSSNYDENTVEVEVPVFGINGDDFYQPLSSIEDLNEINATFNNLFFPKIYNPLTPVVCSIDGAIPENNSATVKDAIFSFKQGTNGMLVGTIIYSGYLNIPIDAIITTEGVEENIYYKRVYFSDYYNPTRVVNIRDKFLKSRNANEFDIKTKGVLLSPRINRIETQGQLKAMTVFYTMKLITENGQVSDFSPLSKAVKIAKTVNGLYTGGDVSEISNKSVIVDCYIPDKKNFKEVQLVAIEFEANNVPSAIRLVGTKLINSIVTFEHFGSESEYKENITLSDLFKNSLSWRYNSDFTTKNNKLIVSGLRNDPLYLNSKNFALDFSLKSFNVAGETYTCLLNPNPVEYNLINATFNSSFFFVKRKLYREIQVFGNFKMKLTNKLQPSNFFEYTQSKIVYDYTNQTTAIANFLLATQVNLTFAAKFPNLNIRIVESKILFEPINPLVLTDFSDYNLEFSTSQVIVDLDNDIENKTISWPTTEPDKEAKLVYGGISNGWFNGNGVKVTMHSVSESVLTKNTEWMEGNTIPLKIKEPSLRKGVMKGEIYRIGIQWYKNGNKLFTTVLGDLKIPDIGQKKRELDINGNVIITSDTYKNWSVVGNDMFAERIELQFDIRINCQLSKEVDSYQIVYVERTENNRTILAQGISAPLERMVDFTNPGNSDIAVFKESMVKKWMLPSNGGPVYDRQGLLNYDENPNQDTMGNPLKTIITNRKAFYFDSPDFVHNKISTNFAKSCVLEYIETIATDHDRHNILGGYNAETCGNDLYHGENPNDGGNPGCMAYSSTGGSSTSGPYPFGDPKFSQKIPSNLLSGINKTRPFWVNTSVFCNRLKKRTYTSFQNTISSENKYVINQAEEVAPGEILSGYKLNDDFDYANHALSLGNPGWFYGLQARRRTEEHTTFKVANLSTGRKTLFVKSNEDYFSDANIAQTPYLIKSKVNFGDIYYKNDDELNGQDAYIVSNLKRNNEAFVYGGRTEFAYSSNEYIPLSDVIPVDSKKIVSQVFYVEGDTYCSLYLRNKTSYEKTETPELIRVFWRNFGGVDKNHRRFQYNKYNAWCYAVVLESTIEPRLTNSDEFYLFSKSIDFNYEELYNSAYLQENDLKKSIPVPYNFKDDPVLNNIIAVSDVKLNGDYIDAWTQFSTNEFYELDKNMGSVLNLAKEKDEIYAIQALQTSKIMIDERSFVTPDNDGTAIQIGQGNGISISGHEIVSDYGTSLRRAVIDSPFGFVFYDEIKNEIVKITQPLLASNLLSLEIRKIFFNDIVVNVDGYYDDEFKETNIRLRTKNGLGFVISYNELLKIFNGKIAFNNDLYFKFQNKIFAPYLNSTKIGELNRGEQGLFFEQQKNIILKVISAPVFHETKINKGIAVYLNTNYPLLKTTFITSLGHSRIIPGLHHWYKVREGVHTLPAKNPTDYDDIRGEWCSIELESEIKDNKEVKIFSLINFFRKSYK
jgi:hypothetical protein